MAKKKKKTEELPEPVKNIDQFKEAVMITSSQQLEVAKCDLKSVDIKSMIRDIRVIDSVCLWRAKMKKHNIFARFCLNIIKKGGGNRTIIPKSIVKLYPK